MHVHMYARMYVCMHEWCMYACMMYACMHVFICMHACMYTCMHVRFVSFFSFVFFFGLSYLSFLSLSLSLSLSYTHTHTHKGVPGRGCRFVPPVSFLLGILHTQTRCLWLCVCVCVCVFVQYIICVHRKKNTYRDTWSHAYMWGMYVCRHVVMYACMHVCMYACMHVGM